MRTGVAQLPLHGGRAPAWLFQRMTKLARELLRLLVEEFGPEEALTRLSDPFWFQAFGCVLGFDWHSSGVTTTVCGAVSEAVAGHEADYGFFVAGGKGRRSRRTPEQIRAFCDGSGLDGEALVWRSRLTAKIDSAAVQDGYQVYQHTFLCTLDGTWAVVQQGMNEKTGMARRYHWLRSPAADDLVNDPHAAVCCDARHDDVLNLVAGENEPVRQRSIDLSRLDPDRLLRELNRVASLDLPRRHGIFLRDLNTDRLKSALLKTYETVPEDYAALLSVPGVGAKSLRALALVAELLYGTQATCRDPARFSFAHGGKDGIPYPVDRETYDRTIELLHTFTWRSRVDLSEKQEAFRRLTRWNERFRETGGVGSGGATPRRSARGAGAGPVQLELFERG